MDILLSQHQVGRIIAGDGQEQREVAVAPNQTKPVLAGNAGLSTLIGGESIERLQKAQKVAKAIGVAQQQQRFQPRQAQNQIMQLPRAQPVPAGIGIVPYNSLATEVATRQHSDKNMEKQENQRLKDELRKQQEEKEKLKSENSRLKETANKTFKQQTGSVEFSEAEELINPTISEFISDFKSGDDEQRIKTIQSLLRYAAGGYESFEQLAEEKVFDEISNLSRSCGRGPLFLVCDCAKWMNQCTRKAFESQTDEIYHLRHELEELKEQYETDHSQLEGLNQSLEGDKVLLEMDIKRLKDDLVEKTSELADLRASSGQELLGSRT
ncbi:MAG: hypothetical protein EZS28_039151 [Streblomastix strix]|uniref:Uncharacterized protein n=1 Tax=Streblomastix strix TaxID=222440 RepID=A0A5J4U5W5_9EUKA|nr:MAG: hypothetical protein EZS28_039151 [Streblomastix strix]